MVPVRIKAIAGDYFHWSQEHNAFIEPRLKTLQMKNKYGYIKPICDLNTKRIMQVLKQSGYTVLSSEDLDMKNIAKNPHP